jgi:hypothetical protein
VTLTVRSATVSGATTKGSALTHAELDENFNHLSQASNHTFTQSGNATSESVEYRLKRTVFITSYMSAADRTAIAAGTTTTIDTAVSNAHTDLPSTGGEIVFPPFAGKYKLTASPTLTKRVVFRGMGAVAVTAAGTGSAVILKDAAATAAILSLSVDGCAVQDLEVEGEGGNTGDGIEIKAGRCRLTNVAVYSMGQDGIRIGTDSGGENCNLWKLDNVKSKSNTRHGILVHDGAGAVDTNAGTLIHPDVQSNGGDGIFFNTAHLNTVIGGASQNNTGAGLRLGADAKYNAIFGLDPEGNDTASNIITTSGGVDNFIFCPATLYADCTFGEVDNRIEIRNYSRINNGDTGTFTPVVAGTTSAGAGTYTTQVGRYTRLGNIVQVSIVLVWSAHTGTGNTKITGLPFTSAGSGQGRTSVAPLLENFTYGAGIPQLFLSDSATEMNLYLQTSAAGVAAIALDTAASIYASFTYAVA